MKMQLVHNLGMTERCGRLVLGLGIILAVLMGNGPLGWAAVLPLAALYPALTAVVGWDPLNAWLERHREANGSAAGRRDHHGALAYVPAYRAQMRSQERS